ncbi:unnamed protein product [Parascedosporium putredinis]|uniref:BZIP domain-containing protein n=1 Tax=Parascedosporium putredinis TaxID=1442378 RepID=A0A9P1MDK5_9PEZI|nr:unnamed protein product [Parascedosporium putredinis]CAI7998737.1 unnamed protein product [Parascedosporium putredinis]
MTLPSASTSEQQSADNSTAIRIRDNQRRSRARHREFVETLQRKVQEYERQGVHATLEMQRAARDVAVENARLRSLLTQRGVSEDEIEGYLVSSNLAGKRFRSAAAGGPRGRWFRLFAKEHLGGERNQRAQCEGQHQPRTGDFGMSPPATFSAASSPHEMPCNTAAQIIAGAQGHGDEQRARRAIGCQDSSECMVRNTTVFQALEDR